MAARELDALALVLLYQRVGSEKFERPLGAGSGVPRSTTRCGTERSCCCAERWERSARASIPSRSMRCSGHVGNCDYRGRRCRRSLGPTMPPRRDDAIQLKDRRSLAYAEWGDERGAPVLFFHGNAGSRLYCPNDAATAAARVRPLTIDRPGVGGSDVLPRRRFVDWPRDVREFTDALGIDRFGVVGWSAGGPYAAAGAVHPRPAHRRRDRCQPCPIAVLLHGEPGRARTAVGRPPQDARTRGT
jgi:hypothetical protein